VDKYGVTIRDTPGIMDEKALPDILSAVKTSRIVIYVALGELCRPEFEVLKQIHAWQFAQNARGPAKRKMMLFVNKQDIALRCMTSEDRCTVRQRIKAQIAGIVDDTDILFGCARSNAFSIDDHDLRRYLHEIPLANLRSQINSETMTEVVRHAA